MVELDLEKKFHTVQIPMNNELYKKLKQLKGTKTWHNFLNDNIENLR